MVCTKKAFNASSGARVAITGRVFFSKFGFRPLLLIPFLKICLFERVTQKGRSIEEGKGRERERLSSAASPFNLPTPTGAGKEQPEEARS